MLVVDTNVALWACGGGNRFDALNDELVAPHLMWSEAASVLREATYRGDISSEKAQRNLRVIESSSVQPVSPPGLRRAAFTLAEEFGWAKTYDAEFVALAALLEADLVTEDTRLRRGTERLGFVKSLDEILA